MKEKKTAALILAAGSGSRVGGTVTKQQRTLAGETVLWHSVEAFLHAATVDAVVIVAKPSELDFVKKSFLGKNPKIISVVPGGENRRASAKCGFEAVQNQYRFVAVHDAARCLVTPELIDKTVRTAWEAGAAILASPVTDTVKMTTKDGKITKTVPRDALFFAETPQVFATELYARSLAASESGDFTDDASMAEAAGISVAVVPHGEINLKITAEKDFQYAEYLFALRTKKEDGR